MDDLGYVPYYEDGHLLSITDNLSYDDFTSAYGNDSFETLDDSLNIYDDTSSLVHVDFSDGGVVTGVMPMDDLFDYWSDSISEDASST